MQSARSRVVGTSLVVALTCVLLLSPVASAQQAASGIAGVVKDTSGGVLPGVTVEAASPALIEKVRTVVTDEQGRYNIVDLRPGTYVVTFALGGFSTVKREGIDLSAGFTATVNTELRVGDVAETITVTGAAPVVDTQNVRQQKVISRDLLDALPSGGVGSMQSLVALNSALTTPATSLDVGGASGEGYYAGSAYGSKNTDNATMLDGMKISDMHSGGTATIVFRNAALVEEVVLQTGGISAESGAGGVVMNVVSKEGGNKFSAFLLQNYANGRLQSDNLTDAVKVRGLTLVNKVKAIWDSNAALGGPVLRNKLWFYTSHRSWGTRNTVAGNYFNKTQGTPFYTPDLSRPALSNLHYASNNVRLTWQAAAKHKVTFFLDSQRICLCRGPAPGLDASTAPEAAQVRWYRPMYMVNPGWSWPVSSKLLLEAAGMWVPQPWTHYLAPETRPEDIRITELSTGYSYNNRDRYGPAETSQANERVAVSYVTGSHTFKTGFTLQQGWRYDQYIATGGGINYQYLRGVPVAVVQWLSPLEHWDRQKAELGLFVQDQWRMDRLTLNTGLRFEYLNSYVPAQHLPANQYFAARDFAPVYNVPNFKDLMPRLGAAWDLFGTGKTAIKGTVGRYVQGVAVDLATAANPTRNIVASVTRTWSDANGDYVPQASELGAYNQATFGQPVITQRLGTDVTQGFGQRGYNWAASAEVQHELVAGVSLNAGYYRRWYGNFTVTDNLAVSPADYSPYCITAPVDARLPGGGGYQVCGLYDGSPAKFGKVDNLVTQAASFGKQTDVSNFFNIGLSARLPRRVQVGGGWNAGRTVTDQCFVVDSPGALRFCRVVTPFSATRQLKLYGSYPLPWGVRLSAVFQNLPGIPITATYVARNAEIAPSLGRNLAQGPGGTATISLIEPNTMFEDRITQLDLRVSKDFIVGKARLQTVLDIFNALNAGPILSINTRYGPQWLQPQRILDGRLLKFGLLLTF